MASINDFKEILPFLKNEREDVRKMALQAINTYIQHKEVADYFVTLNDEIVAVTELLAAGPMSKTYIGDVLTILINIADKGSAGRVMVSARAIQRAMLLLEKGGLHPALQELCLILIANLTSVSVDAVEALLQADNNILQGHYLAQLVRRFVDAHLDASELQVEDEGHGKGRDTTKWVAAILANCTQCHLGRKLIMEDEQAIAKFITLLGSNDHHLRFSVTSLFKNLFMDKEYHEALALKYEAASTILSRVVHKKEGNEDVLDLLCESLKCLATSDPGVKFLDGTDAKKLLTEVVESLPEKGKGLINELVSKLDDIQDVQIVTDADEKKDEPKQPPPSATSGVEELDDAGEPLPQPPQDDETRAAEEAMGGLD